MAFSGFSKETADFFLQLKKNNTKKWFEEHRHIFDTYVLAESELFVLEMGSRLYEFTPDIQAIPKIDKSIFRLHRDIRFSPDKRPYKTHMGLLFWEGNRKKTECPGFYFQLEPEKLFLAAGSHMLPADLLSVYRDAVVDDKKGAHLKKIIDKISLNPQYKLGWEKYKKVPRGYDSNHPRADLLRFGGIGFSFETKKLDPVFSNKAVDFCFSVFRDFAPLHAWLTDIFKNHI